MSLGDHVVRAVTGGATGGRPSHVVVWDMTLRNRARKSR